MCIRVAINIKKKKSEPWPSLQILQMTNDRDGVEKQESSQHCWYECKLMQPLWKTVREFPQKTKNRVAI